MSLQVAASQMGQIPTPLLMTSSTSLHKSSYCLQKDDYWNKPVRNRIIGWTLAYSSGWQRLTDHSTHLAQCAFLRNNMNFSFTLLSALMERG